MRKVIDLTLEVQTGRNDGVAVLSMMRMHLPVEKDVMFPMMTALQCISPLSLGHNSSCIIVDL